MLDKERKDPLASKLALPNMALEMRTPLAAILGYTEMMYDARQPVSERLKCIGRIRENIVDLTAMIDNLVDLTRVESDSFSVKRIRFTLLPFLGQIFSSLKAQAWKKRIGFHTTFENGIPEVIDTDPQRLKQILLSVIGNIIRYSERGRILVHTRVHLEKDGRELLEFSVRDTAPGLEEDLPLDFAESLLGDDEKPLTRRYGGVGLSLVLARRLTRLLGGEVEFRKPSGDVPGGFVISVDPGPLENVRRYAEVAPEDLELSEVPVMVDGSSLDGMRLLLVEDAPDIQLLIRHFLSKNGVRVDIAENGVEAMKKAKQNQYDVILMDLQLPVVNGIEATKCLQKDGYRGPVIALTGCTRDVIRDKCMKTGFTDFLTKPIHAKNLVETLARYRV